MTVLVFILITGALLLLLTVLSMEADSHSPLNSSEESSAWLLDDDDDQFLSGDESFGMSSSSSIFEDDSNFIDNSSNFDINPATGLPMTDGIGSIDVGGSPFGMDIHDSFSSMDSGISSFDDSFSSISDSFSSFDDW